MTNLRDGNVYEPLYAYAGAYLARVRAHKRMRQSEVAHQLGVHHTAVTHWERGDHRILLSVFVSWCKVLNEDPGAVLNAILDEAAS